MHVGCDVRYERILIALDIRAAIMILAISMLYTQSWHEVLEGGGYNLERSMHYESFCACIKKSDRHLYLIYMLLKVNVLHSSWLFMKHDLCISLTKKGLLQEVLTHFNSVSKSWNQK